MKKKILDKLKIKEILSLSHNELVLLNREIFGDDAFGRYNKKLAWEYGLEFAIYAGYLISKEEMLEKAKKLPNNAFFYCEEEEVFSHIKLSSYQQRKSRNIMISKGLLQVDRRGSDRRNYYKINHLGYIKNLVLLNKKFKFDNNNKIEEKNIDISKDMYYGSGEPYSFPSKKSNSKYSNFLRDKQGELAKIKESDKSLFSRIQKEAEDMFENIWLNINGATKKFKTNSRTRADSLLLFQWLIFKKGFAKVKAVVSALALLLSKPDFWVEKHPGTITRFYNADGNSTYYGKKSYSEYKSFWDEIENNLDNLDYFKKRGKEYRVNKEDPYPQAKDKQETFLDIFNGICRSDYGEELLILNDLSQKQVRELNKSIFIIGEIVHAFDFIKKMDKGLVVDYVSKGDRTFAVPFGKEERSSFKLVCEALNWWYRERLDEPQQIELYNLISKFTYEVILDEYVKDKYRGEGLKISSKFLDAFFKGKA